MRHAEVVLFDGGYTCTVAALRALSKRGVACRVIDSNPFAPTRFSRDSHGFERCPPLDSDAFAPWLREQFVSGAISRVLPTSDWVLYRLNQLRDVLPEPMLRALPSEAALLDCLFKDRFGERCRQLGLDTPPTQAPLSVAALEALLPTLQYPVLMKPRSHVGIGMQERGRVLHDADALRAAFAPYQLPPAMLAMHTDLCWPLIQQIFVPEQGGVHSVCGFRDPVTGVVALSTVVKLEQWPPDVGVGIVFEHRECPALEALARPAIEALIDRGIFEIEFIRHEGRWYAIDCNPRIFSMIGLHCARGDDLPWLWYRSSFGAPDTLASRGVVEARAPMLRHWRCEVPFEAGYWTRFLRQPTRASLWQRYRQRRQGVASGPGWRDPLAHLLFLLSFWRHPRALVRPFWRERLHPVVAAQAARSLPAES